MDDIVFADPASKELDDIMTILPTILCDYGCYIAPEKIQKVAPRKYLGQTMLAQTIKPQILQIKAEVKTLNDAQCLLGTISWVRPVLRITNNQIQHLTTLLKGNENDLNAPRRLDDKSLLELPQN